jgi:hypothetical protein
LLLVEYPPVLPGGEVKGGHLQMISGRRVSYYVRPAPNYGFAGRWKTRSAVYVLVANGTNPGIFERAVGCLP